VAISTIALVGWKELSTSEAPLALAASKALGDTGIFMLSSFALFATTNTVLMMLISGSRIIFGMAKNNALPFMLARVHASRKTPWVATIITMVFAIAAVIPFSGRISDLASVSVFSMLIVFVLVNLSVIWLRFRRPNLQRY
jgi:APA family basic amino acid/polyamine antiporter